MAIRVNCGIYDLEDVDWEQAEQRKPTVMKQVAPQS
jgi:hypothetical protein